MVRLNPRKAVTLSDGARDRREGVDEDCQRRPDGAARGGGRRRGRRDAVAPPAQGRRLALPGGDAHRQARGSTIRGGARAGGCGRPRRRGNRRVRCETAPGAHRRGADGIRSGIEPTNQRDRGHVCETRVGDPMRAQHLRLRLRQFRGDRRRERARAFRNGPGAQRELSRRPGSDVPGGAARRALAHQEHGTGVGDRRDRRVHRRRRRGRPRVAARSRTRSRPRSDA